MEWRNVCEGNGSTTCFSFFIVFLICVDPLKMFSIL